MHYISQFGTFEVENYGDQLFPFFLEKELAARLPQLTLNLFSPLSGRCGSQPVNPIIPFDKSSIFAENSPLNGIVIGGGDLISFSTQVAKCYETEWIYPISPHAACWAIPSIKRPSGVPLIWNAPGIPYPLKNEEAVLVRTLANMTDYLSVRDEISLFRLKNIGVEKKVTIVPDTACLLSKYFNKEMLQERAAKIFNAFGVQLQEVCIFQMHPSIPDKQIPKIVSILHDLKKRLNKPIFLLPIGICHDDKIILEKLQRRSQGTFLLIDQPLDSLTIASLIAHSACFVGTSLHGNITAFSYGIPYLLYNVAGLSKLEGFAQLTQEPERCIRDLSEAIQKTHLLLKKPSSEKLQNFIERIEEHFDEIATFIKQGSSFSSHSNQEALLDHYLQIIHESQNYKKQLHAIKESKSWHFACILKKWSHRFPFFSKITKSIFQKKFIKFD